jgi:hypothetical protein
MRILTPAMAAQEQRELEEQYFLVRQGTLGEIFRCRRCKKKDKYMTLMCVERPYSGVAQGLFGYYERFGTPEAYKSMTPQEIMRMTAVRRMLGLRDVPDVATSHPRFARSLGVSERDLLAGAVALGIVVPIDKAKAQKLQNKINARGLKPKLLLPGLHP